MSFLIEQCTFFELTEDVLATCQPFSCGNADLDDFFLNDATRYAHFLMGKTYCFRLNSDPSKIVAITPNTFYRLTAGNGAVATYAVTALDRMSNESKAKRVRVK